MQDIKKIVTPVDLGTHTEKLVEYSVRMANKLSASISFIHVVELYATGDMMLGMPIDEQFEKKRLENAEARINNIIEDHKDKCARCTGKAILGDVVDEVLHYAEAEKADLIIIGTHGKRGLEKILLGSVAERVVKRAPCPTLVMNPYK